MAGTGMPEGTRGVMTNDPCTSYTLPSRYYTDPAVLGRELVKIFRRSWCYAGHIGDLEAAGNYFTGEIGQQPIAVVRGSDGEIRAFYNVCQHRGHILLKDRGKLTANIVCPYHAWNYGLDGALHGAPLTHDMSGFDKQRFGLPQLGVSIVAGLIFVNPDRHCRPLGEEAPGFERRLLEALPGLPQFVATDRTQFEIAANWKVVYDNFSEGYYIPVALPALSKLHGRRTTASVVEERFQFYKGVGRPSFEGFAVKPEEPYLSWQLWPNHCMLSLPGSQHFIILRMTPDSPGKTHEREAVAVVENVRRGLASLGYGQGRYVADQNNAWYGESGLHSFHMLLLKELARGG